MNIIEISKIKSFLQEITQIFNSKTLYLLGAGVSAEYIKPHYDLYSKAKEIMTDEIFLYPISDSRKLTEEDEHRIKIIGGHKLFKTKEEKLMINETNVL